MPLACVQEAGRTWCHASRDPAPDKGSLHAVFASCCHPSSLINWLPSVAVLPAWCFTAMHYSTQHKGQSRLCQPLPEGMCSRRPRCLFGIVFLQESGERRLPRSTCHYNPVSKICMRTAVLRGYFLGYQKFLEEKKNQSTHNEISLHLCAIFILKRNLFLG